MSYERIIKFGGIDPLSLAEAPRGRAEPDADPRGSGNTQIIDGLHLMSAVERLEPAVRTQMAYFDPMVWDGTRSLDDLEEAVAQGDIALRDVLTITERFTPLVNPRRSREKKTGEREPDSDADLWHVPTSNYRGRNPRQIFGPLATAIDANGAVSNSGAYGEFRERRRGGEVHGHVWFDDFDVGLMEDDPVRLGFQFRWNYFGDLSFSFRPFAQATVCKNTIRALDDWTPVMAHRKDPDFAGIWTEALRDLGLYGDALSQQIQASRELLFSFQTVGEPDLEAAVPVPLTLEAFYGYLGFPEPRIPAEHAREQAINSADRRETSVAHSAWHVHSGATYWLSWHWDGAESSRAFREYRRTADDLLINPGQMVERAAEEHERDEFERAVVEVAGDPGASWDDLDEEEREEVEQRMMDNETVVELASTTETLADLVSAFEETEGRLDRIQEAIAETG